MQRAGAVALLVAGAASTMVRRNPGGAPDSYPCASSFMPQTCGRLVQRHAGCGGRVFNHRSQALRRAAQEEGLAGHVFERQRPPAQQLRSCRRDNPQCLVDQGLDLQRRRFLPAIQPRSFQVPLAQFASGIKTFPR